MQKFISIFSDTSLYLLWSSVSPWVNAPWVSDTERTNKSVLFILGISAAHEFYVPTFRNNLFRLLRRDSEFFE